MRNIKLVIEYDGTDFFGWQYQPNNRTVQGEIEKAIRQVTQEDIRLIGAGRTDHGVHALGQIANFKTHSTLSLDKIMAGINALTADDIYIKQVTEVPPDFHARFSARSKVYRYQIMTIPSPLNRRYYWYVAYAIDIERIKAVLPHFLGEHDFQNLSVSDGQRYQEIDNSVGQKDSVNTKCVIYDLTLTSNNFDIILTIEANRFLRKMVRGIVGFIIDVGRGRFGVSDVELLFDKGLKGLYFAPAHGLCLVEVKY